MSLFNFFDNKYILVKNFISKNISSVVTGKILIYKLILIFFFSGTFFSLFNENFYFENLQIKNNIATCNNLLYFLLNFIIHSFSQLHEK